MKILDIQVEARDKLGSANARRYRRSGQVPCVLYGRGKDTVPLTVPAATVDEILKSHTHLIRLQLEERQQMALVRDVVWDPFAEFVQHVDFVRVEMEDEVKVTVALEYHGVPEGQSAGGVAEVLLTDIEVFSKVSAIPERIDVDVSGMDVGDSLHVEDISYPEHVRPARGGRDLLVHCVVPKKAAAAAAEGEEALAAEEAGEAAAPAAAAGEES